MAQIEQMIGDNRRSLFLVGFDGVGDGGIVVDDDHGHAPLDEFREMVVIGLAERRPHDQAIHAAIEQPVDLPQTFGLVLFEVGQVAEAADPDRDG